MDAMQIQLLVDLHRNQPRLGPGGDAEARLAMALAGLNRGRPLKIADVGCGTGAGSLLLAKELTAEITAVDFLPAFLDVLQARADEQSLADRITTLQASMDVLPFADDQFDVIWSEGAIYNMGFEAGIAAWRPFLKRGGMLVVSEITWLGARRPEAIQTYWQTNYPEIDLASAKMAQLERHGFSPVGYLTLPPHCWLDNYYRPVQRGFDAFLERNGRSPQAEAVVAAVQEEITLYETHGAHYSYGVYVAKKC